MTDVRTLDEDRERQRLAQTVRLLETARDRLTGFIDGAAREIQSQKEYLWQNARDMDGVEKAGIRIATDVSITVGQNAVNSAHIAKGLEFDVVIVPYVDEATYATEMDRGMLYIACTRAMHELHLTHEGTPSRLLEFASESIPSLV